MLSKLIPVSFDLSQVEQNALAEAGRRMPPYARCRRSPLKSHPGSLGTATRAAADRRSVITGFRFEVMTDLSGRSSLESPRGPDGRE